MDKKEETSLKNKEDSKSSNSSRESSPSNSKKKDPSKSISSKSSKSRSRSIEERREKRTYKTVYVKGLKLDLSEGHLEKKFAEIGPVERVKILWDPTT